MDPQSVIFSGRGYYYLGYAMLNEEQARAFLDAYRERRRDGGDFSEDLIVPDGQGFGGGNVIYRLKTGIERSAITDIHEPMASSNVSSSIPVMLDRDAYHEPGGINVLYLDGHVEYVAMGSKWPAKQWFMDEMAELDPMWVKKE